MASTIFKLPAKGVFRQCGPDDPLPYYYHPIVGRLFSARIESCMSLLSPPYESILDVGYGSGIVLPTLSKMCKELVAVDRDSDPAQVLLSLEGLENKPKLFQCDAADLNYEGGAFDLVAAISVLEEVTDLASVLTNLDTLVKKGGHLLVGMPRVDLIMDGLFRLIGHTTIEEEHITNYLSFLEMIQTDFPFKLVKMATMPQIVPNWAALYYSMLLIKTE